MSAKANKRRISDAAQNSVNNTAVTIKDDADGHLEYKNGDFVDNRYEIISTLGEGTFGRVVKCRDLNKYVTLKVVIIRKRPLSFQPD